MYNADENSYLASGRYSDLTIVCDGNRFKVHKIVLDATSPVLRKLLSGKFKKAEENRHEIELDDDPEAMIALVHFFYHFVYLDAFRQNKGLMSFAVKVYAIADKYGVPQPQSMAAQRLKNVCHPKNDFEDFINTIYLIDGCTNPNDPTLWQIVLPLMKNNMSFLLQHDPFRKLLSEIKDLNFKLLALLDQSNGAGDGNFQTYFTATPPPHGPPIEIDNDEDDTSIPIHRPRGLVGSGRRLG